MRRISEQSLTNAALFYLRRYAATRHRLEQVLLRKARRVMREKQQDDEATRATAKTLIDAVVARMVRNGYVDDERLAESKGASLHRQGKSNRMIKLKLRQQGVPADVIAKTAVTTPERELEAASRLAKKKKLGVYGQSATDVDRRRKDLGVLMRAGFSFLIARRALAEHTRQAPAE